MSKRLSAIIAAATLGLSAAAFAQTGTTTQNPAASPASPSTGTGSSTQMPSERTGRSGTMSQSGAATAKQMSTAEVRQELQNQGYTNISNLKKKGSHYEGKGMKDGKTVSFNVDAKSGKVVAR